MRSCITMSAVASLLLAAGGPNPGPENAPPVPGWSFATEGSGIPRNQDAAGFATGVDREVAHGGHASVSIRSIVAEAHFRAVTQLIKADAYRGNASGWPATSRPATCAEGGPASGCGSTGRMRSCLPSIIWRLNA